MRNCVQNVAQCPRVPKMYNNVEIGGDWLSCHFLVLTTKFRCKSGEVRVRPYRGPLASVALRSVQNFLDDISPS
jgi:hypothetical protein